MRRGFSATELVCAAVVVGVIGITVGPAMVFVGRQNKTSTQHLEAMNAVSNILDEVSSQPYDEVTEESVAALELPEWVAEQLPDAKLKAVLKQDADGKRVSVELTWTSNNGAPQERESMHVWIFDSGGSA